MASAAASTWATPSWASKGRIAFEAPAALIAITAHKELEKLVLTKHQQFWKDHLADVYGNMLHEGLYFDPVMRDIEAMIDSSQATVTGEVRVRLFKGHIQVEGVPQPLLAARPHQSAPTARPTAPGPAPRPPPSASSTACKACWAPPGARNARRTRRAAQEG